MPSPSQPTHKSTQHTSPCVCCHERPHEFVPDRDLDGFVCRDCGLKLKWAERWLSQAEGAQ